MKNFIYKLKDDKGKALYGFLEAEDKKALKSKLRDSGYYFITAYPFEQRRIFQQKANLEILLMFTHRLSSLIESGIPILTAMHILWRQTEDKKMQLVISHVRRNLEQGRTISEALKDFPNIFPIMYRALIAVAEKSGGLVIVLKQLTEYLEYQRYIMRRIGKATIYPSVVIVFALLILFCMFRYVVPIFQTVLMKLNVDLPPLTQAIINISDIIKSRAFLVVSFLVLVGGFFLIKQVRLYKPFIKKIDFLKLHLPFLGGIFYTMSLGRFMHSLSILISAGLPILESFEVAKATVDNQIIREGIEDVQVQVEKGRPLYDAFCNVKIFPVMLTEMIGVGESSGKMVLVIEKLAIHFDEEVDYQLKKILNFIEPLLIILVGGIVIITLLAIYSPIFTLWQNLAG